MALRIPVYAVNLHEGGVFQNYLAMDYFLHGTYHGIGLLRKYSSKVCSGLKGGNSMNLHFLS